MREKFGVYIATVFLTFAISISTASAQSLASNLSPSAPPSVLQTLAAIIVRDIQQIVAAIEAKVGTIASDFTAHSVVASNPRASEMASAGAATDAVIESTGPIPTTPATEQAFTSSSSAGAVAPVPSADDAVLTFPVQLSGVDSDRLNSLINIVGNLAQLLPQLQTPAMAAPFPQQIGGNGAPNTIAAASNPGAGRATDSWNHRAGGLERP